MTTKEKIDQALGISGGKSIDDMLDDLNIQSDQTLDSLDEIDAGVKKASDMIDAKALELQRRQSDGQLVLGDMNDSLKEIEKLIKEAFDIFVHIKDNIVASDLIDSELIQGAAKFLEALHVNINEFVSVYRSKAKFVEKIKVMLLQQEQKKELMELKHKYDLDLLNAKNAQNGGDNIVEAENMVNFDTDLIVKGLTDNNQNNIDDNEDEDEDEDDETLKKRHKK